MILTLFNLAIFGAGRWAAWSFRQRRLVAVQSAAEAVAKERTRIALDLHDIVADSITSMVLLSAGAARLIGTDPERAKSLLTQVELSGRQAITELQRMLGLLRAASDAIDSLGDPRPGLQAVADLLARFRGLGLELVEETAGSPRALDAGLDVSAYRIIQEALTNAARHGNGNAQLDIAFAPGALEIAIANPTLRDPAARVAGGGRGIVGMRERAALLGGSLEAGASDGVFRVRARLPYGDGGNA